MANVERRPYSEPRFLGITSDMVEVERDLFDTFITNKRVEEYFAIETNDRMKLEQPLLWYDLSRRKYRLRGKYMPYVGRGICRAYNMLPERHTNETLIPSEIDDSKKRAEYYTNPRNGLLYRQAFVNDLAVHDLPFAERIVELASESPDNNVNFAVTMGMLYAVLPFYVRDERRALKTLIDGEHQSL